MSDHALCSKIKNMVSDEESDVRANAYLVFSTLISAPDKHEWKTSFDYDEVISVGLHQSIFQ